jgi:hypothetical protein
LRCHALLAADLPERSGQDHGGFVERRLTLSLMWQPIGLLRSRWIRFGDGLSDERRERDPDKSGRTRKAETERANAFRVVSQSSRPPELDRVSPASPSPSRNSGTLAARGLTIISGYPLRQSPEIEGR